MKIASQNVLHAFAVVALCCAMSQPAVSQQKRLSPVEQAERLQTQSKSNSKTQSEAERKQREWDAKAAKAAKSICANC